MRELALLVANELPVHAGARAVMTSEHCFMVWSVQLFSFINEMARILLSAEFALHCLACGKFGLLFIAAPWLNLIRLQSPVDLRGR